MGERTKLSFLETLTDRQQAEGRVAMLININNHFDHVRALLNADQRQVDAVVLFGTAFRSETLNDRRLGRSMPPTFVLARDSQINGVPAVVCDAELALKEIVDHLFERGYRRPGFMAGAPALSTALRRQHHFIDFWKQRGVDDVALISAERYSAQAGAQTVRDYLQNTDARDRVDVLMCENDILAMGALDEIRGQFGLRVPQDMAVVGFDNYELGGTWAYGLTTYEQPRDEMVEVIIGMITGQLPPETVTLPGKLIIRDST